MSKAAHSDRFVEKMRSLGRKIDYIEVEGGDHNKFAGHEDQYGLYIEKMIAACTA